MSWPDVLVAVASGAASSVGIWLWARPELVHRNELVLVKDMIAQQHAAVLRELEQIHELLRN